MACCTARPDHTRMIRKLPQMALAALLSRPCQVHRRVSSSSARVHHQACLSPSAAAGLAYGGLCSTCAQQHHLHPTPEALAAARQLIGDLDLHGRLDFACPRPNPKFSNDYLFTKGPGRMFGVLVCRDGSSQTRVLKAFSGQITEQWHIPGWEGPIAHVRNDTPSYSAYRVLIEAWTRRLQSLESIRADLPAAAAQDVKDRLAQQHAGAKRQRAALSHELFRRIQRSYLTQDFQHTPLQLYDVYAAHESSAKQPVPAGTSGAWMKTAGSRGTKAKFPPPGVGDCCAPKLLHAASARGWHPAGLVEFWYGRPLVGGAGRNKGQPGLQYARRHKHMYGMCEKCEQVLGTMLCGCSAATHDAGRHAAGTLLPTRDATAAG
jgi:hypothetical protein